MDMGYHYLGWDRPFSLLLADRLKQEAADGGCYDDWLIWVPSSRAGRHILNELFTGNEDQTEAFHPPRLVTPANYIQGLLSAEGIAEESQRLFAWKTALLELHPSQLSVAFPVIPEENRDQWAYTLARQLMQLRQRLAEEGWSFAQVASKPLEHDKERWADLAGIEAAYLAQLQKVGLLDPDEGFQDKLQQCIEVFPYKRILLAGVLNLSGRQIHCLEALLNSGIQVDQFLPLPEQRKGSLDSWGRPLKDVWEKEPVPGKLLDERIKRGGDPRELVRSVLELSDVYQHNVDALVIGTPVSEIGRYAIELSRLTDSPFYDPKGIPLWETALGRFLGLIRDFQATGQLQVLRELLGHSMFRKWAINNGISIDTIERYLLLLMQERLIHEAGVLKDSAFGPSREIQTVREFLERMDPIFARRINPETESFAEWIWRIAQTIVIGEDISDETISILSQVEELLQDLRSGFESWALSESDQWELFREQMLSSHHYPDRETEERPVSGWLELPWERAPHMVIIGLPDNEVPGSDGLDSFLTPALCRQLKIYGADESAAFHAFRLRMILESRKSWGRLDILLPDRGLDDDPVTASRFLFIADESEILKRVNLLLGERTDKEVPNPAVFGATLALPDPVLPKRMTVTDVKAYIQNPLRFYFERLQGWSVPEALPEEMDALRFGSLAHGVLESINSADEGKVLSDAGEIEEYLLTELESLVGQQFGSRLAVPVLIQVGAMRERIRAAAGVISRQRLAGWEPIKAEWAFHDDIEMLIGGLPLRGRIDLLERNAVTGEYRIIDYKTSDKASDPKSAHLKMVRSMTREPVLPEGHFEMDGKTWRWSDLQLPLYQLAVEKSLGVLPVCGYFNLAKAVTEVDLSEWHPNEAERDAALACAEAVVAAIRTGYFPWVDPASGFGDSWLPWFGGDYDTNLDPDWLEQHTEELS